MSAKALTDRLAALSPAQRALLEQALRAKEAQEQKGAQKGAPRVRPAAVSAAAQRTVPKRETFSPVPLSIDQERLWFIQQLDPSSPVYNIYNAIRFRGPLDIGVLTAAFQEVVRRQEVLRTAFPAVDGQPVQVIVPHVELVLPEIDLRGLPEEVREAEAERVAEAVVRRPFALDRLPLFNFPLIRLEDEDLVQPSIFHHIIVDRLSAEIMTTEIKAVYAAFLQGQPSPLPELHIQFADFAVWQRRRLEDEAFLAELVGWWEKRLDGAPELLAMPLDRPRPPVQGPDGSRRRLHLSRAHSDGLRALAQAESMTLFIAGVALLQTLLVRWTNQEKLIVGTPYDYRQGPDLEPLMGFFLNQLVLYTDLSGNPTFREAMARVRETALGAYAHHDLPFARLIEHLKPERDLSRIPYTQVVFLLLPLPAHATPGVSQGRADVDEVAMDGFWVDARRTQFDINFALWEEEDGRLAGFIEHSTDLFDVSTIDRMRELFRNLLATVLFEPDRRIWDVPLLSEAQTQQLVREWNLREEVGESLCLHQLFEEQVRRAPDAPAVSFEGRTLSYAELDREANRLAWRLVESGVAPGSRVGLSAERGVELVAGILGILKAGCAYVPLDPEYPQERLEYLIEDSGVAVVVS
ncbi:MAG TPA: condensation domain-containing protein, partial [Thermoanaerobaculia bacterium]|nr:condensation domain-containing protein [Thermoanaerobaculia bacterium]